MTTAASLGRLIERLEQLTGPSAEVDAEIAELCASSRAVYNQSYPEYTASIDAALTISPQDTYSLLMTALAHAAAYFVTFRDTSNAIILRMLPVFICIAALKARKEQAG